MSDQLPTVANAPRAAALPSGRSDVSNDRLGTWIEEWSGSSAPPAAARPPPPAILQPTSTADRQPAAHRPAAAPIPVFSPRIRVSRLFPRLRGLTSERTSRLFLRGEKVDRVSASFVLQLPFKTYGENGQTSCNKPNFPAADPRRAEIPAGKPAEAAFPPR